MGVLTFRVDVKRGSIHSGFWQYGFNASYTRPALLFLNMCDPSRDHLAWKNVASDLSSQGYHVLTFDYRGFDKSVVF